MTQVASCPQCDHELLIPDDSSGDRWARCPACRAFFQVKDAPSRDVPQLEFVDAETISDEGTDPIDTIEITSESHAILGHSRRTFSTASAKTVPEVRAADVTPSSPDDELPTVQTAASDNGASAITEVPRQSAPTVDDIGTLTTWSEEPSQKREAGTPAGISLDITAEELAPEESLESTTERIDKWFRAAKTIADVPASASDAEVPLKSATYGSDDQVALDPLSGNDEPGAVRRVDPSARTLDDLRRLESQPADRPGATIEFEVGDPADVSSDLDFELEDSSQPAETPATRDDSQPMKQSLADSEQSPPQESLVAGQNLTDGEGAGAESPSPLPSSVEASPTVTPRYGSKSRRRSPVRTFLTTALAGVIGLALGYYILLWLLGRNGDFLNLAQYVPSTVLPAAFTPDHSRPAINPEKPPTARQPAADGDEVQAEYQAPMEEPSEFNASDAAPLQDSTTTSAIGSVVDAPTFTADELSVALAAAKDAQPRLIAGNLDDGPAVQREKGVGYMALAELAGKSTFVDTRSRSAYIAPLQQEAEALFRITLANPGTREEVGRIVPKWIASQNRKHGGVFFAGTITGQTTRGDIVECQVDLPGGNAVTLLAPKTQADRLSESMTPVGVTGWIIDRPAERVRGYTGDAPQAVWAGSLIQLE